MNKLLTSFYRAALVLGTAVLFPSVANAGFVGNSVRTNFEALDLGTVVATQTAVVGAGLEVVDLYNGNFDFDYSDSSIRITNFDCCQFGDSGNFNGFRITDINSTIADILAVTINVGGTAYAGFDASRISFTADEILIDMRSLFLTNSGQVITLDVGFATVPEPESLALLATAVLALGFSRRRIAK